MRLRVASVQYGMRKINNFQEFAAQVEGYVRTAEEFGVKILLYPEFMTTQLMSFFDEPDPHKAVRLLPEFTDDYHALFERLAKESGIWMIGGTHIKEDAGHLYNTATLFAPDGRRFEQRKLHMTPTEKHDWSVTPGDELSVFETPWGKIAILVCYDIEFPDTARLVAEAGADILFNPSCTDDKHGFWRVRYSGHARAIENQVYVVNSPTVGRMPEVLYMTSNYGKGSILSPNDLPFAWDGIVAEGEMNQDQIVVGEIDLGVLEEVRQRGAVTPRLDRRTDLGLK